jgi:ketosteroid isomerase-like protein
VGLVTGFGAGAAGDADGDGDGDAVGDRAAGAVEALIDDLYDAVLAGDRPRFDAHLVPDVTIWESHVPALMRGVAELSAYRDVRDERDGPSSLSSLSADQKLVAVFDGTALARYRLVACSATVATAAIEFRVTDVLRHDGAEWRIVHHHAERRTPAPDEGGTDG